MPRMSGSSMIAVRFAKLLGTLAVITSLCGCDQSPQQHLFDARELLADADYDEAVAAAEAGLQAGPAFAEARLQDGPTFAEARLQDEPTFETEDATSWGLELVKLEALARAGHGAEAKTQLATLASLYPNRVAASEYFATAHQLRSAGQGTAAIEVLDMGATLFPYEPVIGRMIEEASAGADPAELELLRSLGYVE